MKIKFFEVREKEKAWREAQRRYAAACEKGIPFQRSKENQREIAIAKEEMKRTYEEYKATKCA